MSNTNVFSNDGGFLKRFEKNTSGVSKTASSSGSATATGNSTTGAGRSENDRARHLSQRRYEFDELFRTRGRSSHAARNKQFFGFSVGSSGSGSKGYKNPGAGGTESLKQTSYSKALAEYKAQLLTDDSDMNRPLVK
ncbi:hypothetical protein BB561_006381 [Smittium simulii]|uniref:Uncharacterized protein n=1 Tax=Smittium simulii TaxID=133385 RepID=A0A2T9Y4R0_9FUNG|nr:hypothetical protein BB561_006381 [Smittium simulii]